MSLSEPVIVFYKSKNCGFCTDVSNIWDNSSSNSELSITASLRKVNPNVRFFIVNAIDRTGNFDENLAPKDLIRYAKIRFPQIILIPGPLWDTAMANLGPNNNIKLIENVKVMNFKIVNEKLEYEEKYDLLVPSDYERWFNDCMNISSKININPIITTKVNKYNLNINPCTIQLISYPDNK